MIRGAQLCSAIALGAGAVAMVAGTFAPWLKSGRITRNSYRTAGLLQRLLDVQGPAGTALNALPLLALCCAASAVIFVIGWHRSAGLVQSVLALSMGALSLAALRAPSGGGVRVLAEGPVITLIGCVVTIVSAIPLVFVIGADSRERHIP